MAEGRGRRPGTVMTKCMNCGDALVVVGPSGELEVPCRRQRCRKGDVSTPIRPLGFIRVPEGMTTDRGSEILTAVSSGQLPADVLARYLDPLAEYREIDGLIVIGPTEIERAFTSADADNPNPLGLTPGWCPQVPVPYTVAQMRKLVEICKSREWSTTPVLWLALPEVAEMPTSLTNQYGWWGKAYDNLGPGKIRSDIQWSNWFVEPKYSWALEPAVTEPTWMIGYELPRWTTRLNWSDQQGAARKRNMSIATACQDALMCNLVAIAKGKKFRTSTYSRTVTIYDGSPLDVDWDLDCGLGVYQFWFPDDADGAVGASVVGVPEELGL